MKPAQAVGEENDQAPRGRKNSSYPHSDAPPQPALSPALLREFYRQLPFWRCHFPPEFLQVGLDCRVFRIFP